MPELVDGLPHLSRWAEAMAARPVIQRALKC
jgi:glutathione S-transferase